MCADDARPGRWSRFFTRDAAETTAFFRQMRVANRPRVLAAGALLAGLVLVPVLNLLTPLFGIALMVHLHKRLARRAMIADGSAAAPLQWREGSR